MQNSMADHTDICQTVRVRTTATKGNESGILEINRSEYDANKSKYQLADAEQGSMSLSGQAPGNDTKTDEQLRLEETIRQEQANNQDGTSGNGGSAGGAQGGWTGGAPNNG